MADEKDAADTSEPLGRTYDFFKHLTSMSLISLGGVLGLPTLGQVSMPSLGILAVVLLVGNAGALALMGSSMMAGAELDGRNITGHKRTLKVMQQVSTVTLFFGLGLFLGLATSTF